MDVSAELNPVKHLTIDVSCVDKNLDVRLMLAGKRKINTLTENELSDIQRLLSSAIVDSNMKGRLRWPLGAVKDGEWWLMSLSETFMISIFPVKFTEGKIHGVLVVHPFSAALKKELDLYKGDYVVVRKVSESGWAEGECKGKAGWFTMAYIEQRQRLPTTNFAAEVY
ncbi:hypothetical protein Bca101_009380 [Brassica carinata]